MLEYHEAAGADPVLGEFSWMDGRSGRLRVTL